MSTQMTAAIFETKLEVRITGTREAVWKSLTDDIGSWWPDEFYAGGEPTSRTYHLEPRPGGRMYESWDGDSGLLWATVVSVEPGKRLQVTGNTFPNWGGPSIWFGTWELESDQSETVLKFSESSIGRITDSIAADKEKGWRFLFAGVLKAHVEGTRKPEWTD